MTTYCLRLFVVLQTLNVVASEIIVGDTCDTWIPSLIVINTTINQLETNIFYNIYCLRLFVVVYKHVLLQHPRK